MKTTRRTRKILANTSDHLFAKMAKDFWPQARSFHFCMYGLETGNFGKRRWKRDDFLNAKVRIYWEIRPVEETRNVAVRGNFDAFLGCLKFPFLSAS
jgi:hypothetical protein